MTMSQAGRLRASLASLLLWLTAAFVAWAVSSGRSGPFDAAVRAAFAAARTPRGLSLMTAVSLASSEQVTPFVVVVIGMLLARRSRAWAWFAVLTTATSTMWHVGLKPVFDRLRPQPSLTPYWDGPSFPSGHALSTLCLVLVIAWWLSCRTDLRPLARRAGGILLIAWALLVGVSRVYLDAHWATDVIGGYLIGIAHFLAAATLASPLLPCGARLRPAAASASPLGKAS